MRQLRSQYGLSFNESDNDIMEVYSRDIETMFGKISVVDRRCFRARRATPIFDKDYGSRMAGLDGCVPGMFFAGNVKVYPGSRTLSSVMGTGYNVADQSL